MDNDGNVIDFLHLLATLGAERYDGFIDPNLAGWAGDLQSFIYNLKLETYPKEYNYENQSKVEKYTEIVYMMFTGAIEVSTNKFTNEDLLSDVDAKNINSIYSETINLSIILKGYYTKYYKKRFSNFINHYNSKDSFYKLVGEYTDGSNPLKCFLLIKFANDAAKNQKLKEKYESSYITEIEGVPIYSLQNPAIITNEESIALKEGFCKWIDLKIREERNNN